MPAHPSPAPKIRLWLPEAARLLLLAAVATWLLHPFATTNQVGAGDALWYANMLADFVLQLRAGIFPVFVGQTDFAFNGAVYPLRVAPLYQHLAGLADLLTGRQLGFFALQHLCVLVIGYAGIFSCYFCLIQISGQHRWTATGLAILYLSCPGLLGTIYTQDQYMTWMTVPFVPVAVHGLTKTFTRDDLKAQVILGSALAVLWMAHAPIALWLTLIAAGMQVARLTFVHRTPAAWKRAAFGGVVFIALAHYPFVSVASLQLPGAASAVAGTLPRAELIPTHIRDAFIATLLPLSDHARNLGDLQLGYGLWLALLASVATWLLVSRSWALGGLIAAAVVLLGLLIPVPGNAWLWAHLPDTLTRITYYWPMQRFFLILAALLTATAQIALVAALTRYPRFKSAGAAMLLAGCCWSLWESRQYVAAGRERTASSAVTAQNLRPENRLLMNHAYGLFPRAPAYFSNGVMDPQAESRLLSTKDERELPTVRSNPAQEGRLTGTVDANPGILNLAPTLRLEPGLRYEFRLAFSGHDYHGILQIVGRSFFREYILPASGESLAFGSTRGASNRLPLWSTDPAGDTLSLRFIPTAPGAKPTDFSQFGRFTLSRVDLATAPISLQSLMPYRATVRSPTPARLVTPRLAMPGYHATLDGKPTAVTRSAEGLVTIPVPAGEHVVELIYHGPPILRFSYWTCLAAWCTLAAGATWLGLRSLRQRGSA